jgi:uncharacterized membrane protein YuzA (DUF378 family)
MVKTMWFVDFPTLVLIIAAGFQIGFQAFFGVNAAETIFGGYAKIIFMLMGLSAIWQLFRQRFH